MTYPFLDQTSLDHTAAEWDGGNFDKPEFRQDDTLTLRLREWLGGMDYRAVDSWHISESLFSVLHRFQPAPSKKDGPLQIAYYLNRQKYEAERREISKPGRAFKKMFPTAPDDVIAKLVDKYLVAFDASELTVTIGQGREAMRDGALASNFAEFQNPRTDGWRKNLAMSCMRYSFDFQSAHPMEAYGSPDFRVVLVHDKEGRLAARCIVCVAKGGEPISPPLNAPIYGCTEVAINAAQEALDAMGAKPADSGYGSWSGAQMLAINVGGARYALPYVDVNADTGTLVEDDAGKWVVLSDDGEFRLLETQGYVYASVRNRCRDCGERYSERYLNSIGDEQVCDYCLSEYSRCDHCDALVPSEDGLDTGYYRNWRGHTESQDVCLSCRDSHYSECTNGEYWRDSDTLETANGETISPNQVSEGYYFCSDASGDYFDSDERAELSDGSVYAVSEAVECGYVQSPEDDLWYLATGTWGPWTPDDWQHRAWMHCDDSLILDGRLPVESIHWGPWRSWTPAPRLDVGAFLSGVLEAWCQASWGSRNWPGYVGRECTCQECQTGVWLLNNQPAAIAAE